MMQATPGSLKVRVIAVKCPCCEGTGIFPGCQKFACPWCKRKKRVDVPTACLYADTYHGIASRGYAAGDYDLLQALEMETKAQAIYDFVGIKAPWSKSSELPSTGV